MEENQGMTPNVENEAPKKVSWDEKYGKKKKNGKKNKAVPIIVAVVILAVIGLGIFVVNRVKKAMNTLTESMGDGTIVQAYEERDMSTYIDVTGVAESQNVEKVITNLQYPVEEIKVSVGDHVKAGDVVCTISTEDIDEKIEQLEAQASDEERVKAKELETASHNLNTAATSKSQTMENANKSISEAKKDFEDANDDYYEKLDAYNKAWEEAAQVATSTDAIAKDPAVSAAETALNTASDLWYAKQYAYFTATENYSDTAATAANSYQSVKDATDMTQITNSASYSSISYQLADYYKMKGETVIIAQTSGIVTSIDAVEGLASTGVLMTIQDDANLEMNVDIKEKDIFSIKEGMVAEFSNSSLTNVTGTGKVSDVYQFATANPVAQAAAQGAVDNTYKAKLVIDDATDILLGMKLKARISTGEEMRTKAVAYTAIMTDSSGDFVYVAEEVGNGMYMVTRKLVEKGMSGDYYTQITGGELEEGDLVITYPNTVQMNSMITINEKEED